MPYTGRMAVRAPQSSCKLTIEIGPPVIAIPECVVGGICEVIVSEDIKLCSNIPSCDYIGTIVLLVNQRQQS